MTETKLPDVWIFTTDNHTKVDQQRKGGWDWIAGTTEPHTLCEEVRYTPASKLAEALARVKELEYWKHLTQSHDPYTAADTTWRVRAEKAIARAEQAERERDKALKNVKYWVEERRGEVESHVEDDHVIDGFKAENERTRKALGLLLNAVEKAKIDGCPLEPYGPTATIARAFLKGDEDVKNRKEE